MRRAKSIVIAALGWVLVLTATAAAKAEPGTLSGRVAYAGRAPAPLKIHPTHDAKLCSRQPLMQETFVIDRSGSMANAVVVLRGVQGGGGASASRGGATLQQKNCRFVPHVQSVTAGDKLTITNDDPTLHNVHASLDKQTLFNLAMPVRGQRIERTLPDPGVVSIRCDSGHTWMRAYVVVAPHGLHTTTGKNGRFKLAGIAPGTYTLWTWHEALGVREQEVTVASGAATEVKVLFRNAEGEKKAARKAEPTAAAGAAAGERLDDLEETLSEGIEEAKAAVDKHEEAALQETRERLRSEGRGLYVRHCATCHGRRGDGKGVSARFLDMPPRDFTRGEYEFRMTDSGKPPTMEDIRRTITTGVLGTPMPSWRGKLTHAHRTTLARYLMTFSDRFWKRSKRKRRRPVKLLEIPEEPPNDKASVARGRKIFVEMKCAQCHGKDGRGDGPAVATMKDDWGDPIRPFDFTKGYYQGGRGAKVVFRTISTGMSGSPMPSYADALEPERRWDLVHYILSLAKGRSVLDYLFRDPAGRISSP